MKYLTIFLSLLVVSCSKKDGEVKRENQISFKKSNTKLLVKRVAKSRKTLVGGRRFQAYKKMFENLDQVDAWAIKDKVNKSPINTLIYSLKSDGKLIGFAREVHTTTGCNSECLPINYTAFYYSNGQYLKLHSEDGLTKVGHAPFSKDDLIKLSYLLDLAPAEFKNIGHPTELTDALSGATLKKYEHIVVKGAAYSTLRIHLYHQETLEFITKFKL